MDYPILDTILDELWLSTVRNNYVSFSKDSVQTQKSHIDYLKALLACEQTHRVENWISKLISAAQLPVIKTLAEFDFSEITSLNQPLIWAVSQQAHEINPII